MKIINTNSGGPGESGVDNIQGWAPTWAKHWPGYNFVSFDPRGVYSTKPALSCGNSTDAELRRRDLFEQSLQKSWDENLKRNHDCSVFNKDSDAKYVGTLANVQDMMHFTELQAAARGKDPKKALINYY